MSVRNGQHFEKQDCVRFRAIELLFSASRGPLTGVTRLPPSPTLSLIASEIKKKRCVGIVHWSHLFPGQEMRAELELTKCAVYGCLVYLFGNNAWFICPSLIVILHSSSSWGRKSADLLHRRLSWMVWSLRAKQSDTVPPSSCGQTTIS